MRIDKFALILIFKDDSVKVELFSTYENAYKRVVEIKNNTVEYDNIEYMKLAPAIYGKET